jgi:hypothetical protein
VEIDTQELPLLSAKHFQSQQKWENQEVIK